jgi:hypothetical protein
MKQAVLSYLIIVARVQPCNAWSAQPGGSPVRLTVVRGRPFVDQAFINGRGPYRFLLDTGAQTNQVQAGLARELGLAASFQVALDTPAGTAHVKGGVVDELSLGSAAARNQECLFTDLDAVRALWPGTQGVLGQEFLSRFDYLLDFGNRRLAWNAEPTGGLRIPIRLIYGRPAIRTSEGELVLDSGSDTVVLRRAGSGKVGQIRTAAGFGTVETDRHFRIGIGGSDYRPVLAGYAPTSPLHEAGQLPACLFRAVYISSSGKYVVLDRASEVPH